MWAIIILAVVAALFLLAFSRVKVIITAEYNSGKFTFQLALGLASGYLPLKAKFQYSNGRINYSLPWVLVDESLERLIEEVKIIKVKKEKRKIIIPVKKIMSSLRPAKFKLVSTIGLHDAAQCAILCGLVQGILYALLAPLDWKDGSYPIIEVTPSFNKNEFSLKLEGIAWFLPAQIIFEGNRETSLNASAGG